MDVNCALGGCIVKVLCCLDGTNIDTLKNAVATMLRADALTIGLIYVTDTGPHAGLERQRERFLRPPGLPPERREQIREAEIASAQDILDEAERAFAGAERLHRTGRPEREIVNAAAAWDADLILICPRSVYGKEPAIGPKSVGHVARFVLDHAPCPVLLARAVIREGFPLPGKP
jgi:nucleotide-binding universal stress UspA family protein